MTTPPVRVEPVATRSQLDEFVALPRRIYRDDPDWVPPLESDVRKAFDRTEHPFHRHSEAQPFLAWRGSRVVGRICAIRNRNHEAFHEEPVGFFGWFECEDDQETADAMFETVRAWLAKRDLETMRGPTSFSTNETCALFVDGERGPPVLMMPHNPPYYPDLLERYGFNGARDLFAWMIESETGEPPEYLARAEKIVVRRTGASTRTLDPSRFDEELATVRTLYNRAWEKNWGFVPMTDAEFDHMADELRPILDENLALFAEDPDGNTIGFALAVPDFNQVLKKMNGRLWPFGILKALYYRRKIHRMRVLILGLLEEYRGKGIDALLYLGLFRHGSSRGITECEQSWILEDNEKMNVALERMGARMYRRYRLYDAPV